MQKRKIFLIATVLLVVITAVSAVLLQSGETFKGWSILPSTTTDKPEIPRACGPNNAYGLIPADEPYVFGNITDEMCECDASSNWIVNPSFVIEDVRLEDAQKPCVCNYGYKEEFFRCVPVSQEETEEQTVTVMTEDYERADLSDSGDEGVFLITAEYKRPDFSTDTDEDTDADSETPYCVFTSPEIDYCTPTPNWECIDNSHLELNRCQCDEGYEFENFKCEPVEQEPEEQEPEEQEPEEQEPEEQEPEEQEPVSESEPAAKTTEKVVSCGDLMDELSVTFYDKDWEDYDEAMRNLELKNCLQDNCDSKFYWAVLYISIRDTVKAKLYYNASECADCQWYTDLSGYASIDMSKFNFDDTLLKDLAQNTLKTCSPPENFDKFLEKLKNAAKAFSSKYFGAEAKDTNRKLAFKSFPTAYAQSVEFSDDVESALEEEYNAIYGEETETESEPKPQCRSLNIVRPEYFQVTEGQKIIKIPVEGFSNQELAIVLDSDPGAVSLFRYKSMEGTITFDNRGTVLDTEKTSVYMDSIDTSKGDIVTVWAMDEKFTGLQECHDALYVEIDKPESVAQVVQQETVNRSESEVQTQVAAATAYAYDYNAPVTLHAGAPEVPKNGPEVIFYVIGAVAILSLKKSFQPK